MIKVLGIRRILILGVLIAANALFALVAYSYLMPDKLKKERELAGLRSRTATLQRDIDRLQIEFEQLEDQRAAYEDLKKQGFFNNQGRRQAELLLERIQGEAGVITAVANIGRGTLIEDEEAQKANHVILSSPVQIKVTALNDVQVYRYIYLLERFFPGHLSLTNLYFERKGEINGTVLRAIASGQSPALVEADITLLWKTMIPSSSANSEEGAL